MKCKAETRKEGNRCVKIRQALCSKLAQKKVDKFVDKYGEFELYNAISEDPKTQMPDGKSIDWDYVRKNWLDFYKANPNVPI
jgi:hypothetical protein